MSVQDWAAERIESHIDTHFRRRSFKKPITLATIPVVLENLVAEGHSFAIGEKYLLSGAAGTRLRNRYAWHNNSPEAADAAVARYFSKLRAKDPVPPVWNGSTQGLDFVIDLRNGFNFFHFLTETLCLLSFVDHDGFDGQVHIHAADADIRPFLRRWIDDVFPRLRSRVSFQSGRHHYDRCLSVLNARHLYVQTGPSGMADLDALAPRSHYWKGREPDRMSLALLAMNSCDQSLLDLREAALNRVAEGDWDHLPRRVWVGRKSERVRPMAGEDALVAELAHRGFQTVFFEDLSPLEQVAIMSRAEIMISSHGAGFANMLFADPDAHCIEIGHLQTCLFRWQDFLPHALASGCRYTSLFADISGEANEEETDIRSSPLLDIRLGPDAKQKVLSYVDAIIGGSDTSDAVWVAKMADMLARVDDKTALKRLLETRPNIVASNPDLLILRANLHLDAGEDIAGRALLERAWEATGDRPFLLERLILLYDRAGLPAPWAALHRDRYPNRTGVLGKKLRRQRRQAKG